MLIVVSVETVCLEQMGRKNGARKSNVLSKAVIVTIHLNNVSITCNQPFLHLKPAKYIRTTSALIH